MATPKPAGGARHGASRPSLSTARLQEPHPDTAIDASAPGVLLRAGRYLFVLRRPTRPQGTQRNSRRNVAKMLVAVVVMFAVCYLPVHVLAMLRYTGVLNSVEDNDIISSMALVSHILCYVNSAINPVIYNFMSEKFRHEFRRAFCCATGSVHEHSTTLTLTSKCKRSFEMQSLTQRTMVNDLKNGYT